MVTATTNSPRTHEPQETLGSSSPGAPQISLAEPVPQETLDLQAVASPVGEPGQGPELTKPPRVHRVRRGLRRDERRAIDDDRIEFLTRIAFLTCIVGILLAIVVVCYELLAGFLP